ncbi:sulfotransferase family protein [Desulfobulbus oligotrophicus]|uniref:Sulfotransferase n=1 Tax=Desulfobulbus oligotrophicus TaxID=1909699 RepID=A0A7T6AR17_9BACT|nr:sulfotransferase [Desulfobulbus oligotrophicus]MDY0390153.1 sulfotransferase [Desulfobulbus oligotrophicus]QQG66398.1 sulfotransferase [Desulfobulbus oligotrophicus]
MSIILNERPVFMIGAERSGTTLVMALLGCHSRIAVPEVVWYYPRFYPYLHTYGDLSLESNFRTLATEMVFGLKTPFWGMQVNPRTIVDEVIELAPERSFAGLYAGMHLRFANYVNKPRWGEKTPHNLYFTGPMHEHFPNAQFIYITRDGRDASVDYMESSFGPTNIYCAAHSWKRCWNAVKQWRQPLQDKGLWLDVRYEDLVRHPEEVMRAVCTFLDEPFEEAMFDFYKTDLARARGASRDHAPLGHSISDKYVGIYKDLLSQRDQRIFAAVAGKELEEAGYKNDVSPEMPEPHIIEKYINFDSRIRAATLDGFEGHIVYESYNDWLIDQRKERLKKGIWKESDNPRHFPIGDPDEEMIIGQRAWTQWKQHFCIKRRYEGEVVL